MSGRTPGGSGSRWVPWTVARAFDQALLVALGVGILIAGITGSAISRLAARRLAAPVADAADATSSLADGHLEVRVLDPSMGPEFAKLATSVNALAHRLQATEQTRRQLTADLAHQLRTPIASIRATVEAVREGVLPADDETLETLGYQSDRLSRLVEDLEVVSRAEERQLLLAPNRSQSRTSSTRPRRPTAKPSAQQVLTSPHRWHPPSRPWPSTQTGSRKS